MRERMRENSLRQLSLQLLLPRDCPLAPVPLPVGHADESVAQQLQMPSLQHSLLLASAVAPSVHLIHLFCF